MRAVIPGIFLFAVMVCGCAKDAPQPVTSKAIYTGAEACATCHLEAYKEWHGSLHRRSMQVPSVETVRGDFTQNNTYTYRGMTSRMFVRDGTYFMETDGADGKRGVYPIEYAIGDRDTQWYLTTLEGGRIQVLPVYWDVREQTWFDPVEGLFDHPQGFAPGDVNYWTNFGRNWNFQCHDCHASQIEKNYDSETGTYATRWTDLSINCETCHGSGGQHVAFWKALPDQVPARDTTLVNLQFLSSEQSVEVCAQCHAHKRIIKEGYQPGDPFYDFYELEVLDSEKFWADGRYRELNYNTLAFLMSSCYTAGHLTCAGCHDSHHLGPVRAEGETRAATYNRVCLNCHRMDVGEPVEKHSNHKTVGCVDCHMPPVEEVKRIGIYDHRILSPVPENTIRFGIPNACNECHSDQTPNWAASWVKTWWGSQADEVAQAEAIDLGRVGDPKALDGLIALSKDQSMVLRASAAVLLGRQADERAEKALIDALDDPHPMVRTRAVEGLMVYGSDVGIEAVAERLDDSSRLVRTRAASMLKGVNLSGDRDKLSEALTEYRTMVTDLLADDPEAQVQVGIDALQRGDDRAGEIAFRQALKVWPEMPDAYAGLGTVFVRNRQFSEAVKMWREAAARDSALVAPLHHACELWEADIRNGFRMRPGTARDYTDLGDTYTLRDSLDVAIYWYRKAIESDPNYAVPYHNLALVCAEAGREVEAEAALDGYRQIARDANAVRELEGLIRERRKRPGE